MSKIDKGKVGVRHIKIEETPVRMTNREIAVLVAAADLWNLIVELKVEHAQDLMEYNQDIHNIQNRVMARPIRRALNKGA